MITREQYREHFGEDRGKDYYLDRYVNSETSFTIEEVQSFLTKRSYEIQMKERRHTKHVQQGDYHSQKIPNVLIKVILAVPKGTSLPDILQEGEDSLDLQTVFKREFKKALLTL